MDLVTFAYTIGVMELLIGIPLVLKTDKTVAWINRIYDNDELMRVIGGLVAILGFLALNSGRTIDSDIEGILWIFALLCVVKGLCIAWWLDRWTEMRRQWFENPNRRTASGVLMVVIGFFLLWAGGSL